MASRDELAESKLEAAQSWEALIEARSTLTARERELDEATRANDQLANRIRRLRGRVVEQHHECRRMDALLAGSNTATESAEQHLLTFRSSRQFPVDRVLDSSGARIMRAHIRIDQGPTAPRLHFLDDTRGETGKIRIGYIGAHLRTATDPT